MRVRSISVFYTPAKFVCLFVHVSSGTVFIPPTNNYTAELITEFIIANYSPPAVPTISESQLENATARLLELYPDVPALGSPFNTGNDTFGLSPGFKRICALCKWLDLL